ncbi:MAG TPA: hypothetical protein VML94_05960 [Thermoplasmata archaeon]|nr:hypothetical protein [Thermoplasmata archaeon]
MSAPARPLPIDEGLLGRFRDAGAKIAWRPAPRGPKRPAGRAGRIAYLHDEEARVERWGTEPRASIAVDSGPLGALVLLLEIDRRGTPTALGAAEAGRDPAFPSGAIVAAWGSDPVPTDARPRLADLVELARYALA